MNTNQHDKEMREAFELVISSKNVNLDKFVSGRYEDENTQSAWWGFKAAYKTSKEIYEADTIRYEAALTEAVSALAVCALEAFRRNDAKIQEIVEQTIATIKEILGEKK